MRTFVTATIFGAASLALIGAASAQVVVPKNQEFYATPVQKGAPVDLPGERLIPGASQSAQLIDGIISPVIVAPLQQVGTGVGGGIGPVLAGLPIIGDGGVAPAPAAAAPRARRHHHHHRLGHHAVHSKKRLARAH